MEKFQAISFDNHPRGSAVQSILSAALQAVDPGEALHRFVQRQGDTLGVAETGYALNSYDRIFVAAIGKASVPMSAALGEILGSRLDHALVVSKQEYAPLDGRFTMLTGGHPVPDERSHRAGKAFLELAGALNENDLLICLISGGGSALVTAPYEGISLADMQALTAELLACGARIDEINTLRRHLDRVKGGGIALKAAPASIISLILSDVVNSPLEAIASGPTAADPTTCQDALAVIQRYQLETRIPQSILSHLRSHHETPKPHDPIFDRVQHVIVGSNELASQAALEQARKDGFTPYALGNAWQGEARQTAEKLCAFLQPDRIGSDIQAPACLAAGGETTVTLTGSGKGGRNQELALAAVPILAGQPDVMLVTLATDGEDGPTDAAGAVVTGESFQRAQAIGLDPAAYLDNNDAYNFFEPLGDLLKPGSTGTNVNDLTFLFVFSD